MMNKTCLILKTSLHSILFLLMTIVSIDNIASGKWIGAITGIMSWTCWAILIIFYDIPDIKKCWKENKNENMEQTQG